MNCNNNTSPLITMISNCNVDCKNSNIYIKCKNMIIPAGQEVIAVQNDKNSTKRTFVLPLINESGISFENKSFEVISLNKKNQFYKQEILGDNLKFRGNYIYLDWYPSIYETSLNGKLKVQIKVKGNDFEWLSNIGEFIVNNTLEDGEYIEYPKFPTWEELDLGALTETMQLLPDDLLLISQKGINKKVTLDNLSKYFQIELINDKILKLSNQSGSSIVLENKNDYLNLDLLNINGDIISSGKVYFPVNDIIKSIRYETGIIYFTKQDNTEIMVDISTLIDGLVDQETFNLRISEVNNSIQELEPIVVNVEELGFVLSDILKDGAVINIVPENQLLFDKLKDKNRKSLVRLSLANRIIDLSQVDFGSGFVNYSSQINANKIDLNVLNDTVSLKVTQLISNQHNLGMVKTQPTNIKDTEYASIDNEGFIKYKQPKINDNVINNENIFSSKGTIDNVLCFKQYKGTNIKFNSIENYPIEFVSTLNYTQEGSGTPSPSNVRNINGIRELVITNNENSYNVSLGKQIYKGTYNSAKGEINSTMGSQIYTGIENWIVKTIPNGRKHVFILQDDNLKSNENLSVQLCNKYKTNPTTLQSWDFDGVWVINNQLYVGGGIAVNFNTIEDWKLELSKNPLQIIYELTTPEIINVDKSYFVSHNKNIVSASTEISFSAPLKNCNNPEDNPIINDRIIGGKTTYSSNKIENILKSPQYNLLTVTAMQEGIGYKSDYNSNDIRRHSDGGGNVILKFNSVENNIEQSFPYETYENGDAIFRRVFVDNAQGVVSRIVIKIDNNYNVMKEETTINVATKEDIQNLQNDKTEYRMYIVNEDEVKQENATDIINNYASYESAMIDFINASGTQKTIAYGFLSTDKFGNQYLITIDLQGNIKQWNKTYYKENQVVYQINEGMVDLDNLTLNNIGESARYISNLNKAINRPLNTSDFGALMILPYTYEKQLQFYIDIENGEFYTRKIDGINGNHSFGIWENTKPDMNNYYTKEEIDKKINNINCLML